MPSNTARRKAPRRWSAGTGQDDVPRSPAAGGRTRPDPQLLAEQAGLRYVTDGMPGITRQRHGTGFTYRDHHGKTIRDEKAKARFRALVIPPAWTDVWICPDPEGHLQVTGRDAKGRKQYRYHARWTDHQGRSKFGRMIVFGMTLSRMRERVEKDLAQRGLPRSRVLGAAVRILDTTPIRVGNERYKRDNDSYGLTTMLDRHVELEGDLVHFRFRGKSGKDHAVGIFDPAVARVIQKCIDLPREELFAYKTPDGSDHKVDSEAVNEYIGEISGYDFTAKDFRTWAGTVRAVTVLRELGEADTQRERKQRVQQAIKFVAADLNNTPATAKAYYIHPGVLDAYQRGTLLPLLEDILTHAPPPSAAGLREEEWPVLALLPRLEALSAFNDDAETMDEELEEALRASLIAV